MYFYFSRILKAELVTEYLYTVLLLPLLKKKCLRTSSYTAFRLETEKSTVFVL